MRKVDNIFISFIALFCALYMFFSSKMKMGTINAPGPGFVPVALGGIGLLVSLILLVTNLKKAEDNSEKVSKDGLLRFFGYLIASIVFIPIMEFLGTIISIFVLVFALAKISGAKGWTNPLLLSVIFTAAAFIVFDLILKVSLPRGIFQII